MIPESGKWFGLHLARHRTHPWAGQALLRGLIAVRRVFGRLEAFTSAGGAFIPHAAWAYQWSSTRSWKSVKVTPSASRS